MQFLISQDDAEQILNLVAIGLATTQGQTDADTTALREQWFAIGQRLSRGVSAMNTAPVRQPIH